SVYMHFSFIVHATSHTETYTLSLHDALPISIHVMAGNRDQHYSHAEQSATLKANLQWAANEWPSLTLHLEGLNQTDVPGYFYARSEEHTSELQSRENLVCRLLLEKKKQTKNEKLMLLGESWLSMASLSS